jgi:hypothetical protein
MPASMALASAAGISRIARPRGRNRPDSAIIRPQRTKAPTAAGKPPSIAPVAASSAPPGVDHAIMIGMRCRSEKKTASTLWATDTARSADAISSGDAPMA